MFGPDLLVVATCLLAEPLSRGGYTLNDLHKLEKPPEILFSPYIGNSARTRSQLVQLNPMKSDRLARLFPKWTFLRAIARSPSGFSHSESLDCLAICDGRPRYLDSDQSAARFINLEHGKVGSAAGAKELVQAFSELRGYEHVEREPDRTNVLSRKPKPDDWTYLLRETKHGWEISCTFLISLNGEVYTRYSFSVSPDGSFAIRSAESVFQRHVIF